MFWHFLSDESFLMLSGPPHPLPPISPQYCASRYAWLLHLRGSEASRCLVLNTEGSCHRCWPHAIIWTKTSRPLSLGSKVYVYDLYTIKPDWFTWRTELIPDHPHYFTFQVFGPRPSHWLCWANNRSSQWGRLSRHWKNRTNRHQFFIRLSQGSHFTSRRNI